MSSGILLGRVSVFQILLCLCSETLPWFFFSCCINCGDATAIRNALVKAYYFVLHFLQLHSPEESRGFSCKGIVACQLFAVRLLPFWWCYFLFWDKLVIDNPPWLGHCEYHAGLGLGDYHKFTILKTLNIFQCGNSLCILIRPSLCPSSRVVFALPHICLERRLPPLSASTWVSCT